MPFLLCAHGSSNRLPRRGKLFGHAVPCARRAQNSLGRVLAFLYTTDCCPRLFCYAPIAARIGCPIRGKLFGHAVPKIHKNSLLKTTSTFYTRFLRSAGYNNRAPENRSEARFLGRGGAALQVVHFAFRQNDDSIGARRRGRNDKDAVLYRDPSSRCAPQDDRGRGEFCRFAPAPRQNGAPAK